jgi:hypothetical protein
VFSINYRLAPRFPYPFLVYDVERAVRYLRHSAEPWDADGEPDRCGGRAAGLLNAPGDFSANDAVDRESAQSSFAMVPLNAVVHALLDPLIEQKAGVRAEIVGFRHGTHGTGNWRTLASVPDWERQMVAWLNAMLHHEGAIGEGIRARAPKQ